MKELKFLRSQMKRTLLYSGDTKIIRKFYSELTMFLLSNNSIFASDKEGRSIMDKRNYYIHDFPMKFKAFLDAKDKNGNYINNDVRNLTFIQRLTNGNRKGISFRNVGKVSSISRKLYSEALESMLASENPEIIDKAVDLFMYSYYDNGLNFGHSNFGIFFTTPFMKSIPRFVESLKSANGEILSRTDLLRKYTLQFLLNHPNFIVGINSRKCNFTYSQDGNNIIIHKDSLNYINANSDSTGMPIEFIRVRDRRTKKDEIFRLSSPNLTNNGSVTGIEYKKIEFNSTGSKPKNYTPFYDSTLDAQEIEWNKLQDRGSVVTIKYSDKQLEKELKTVNGVESNDTGELEAMEMKTLNDDGSGGTEPNALTGLDEDENIDTQKIPKEPWEPSQEYSDNINSLLERIENMERTISEMKGLTDFKDVDDPSNKLCPSKN
jgi:hypothetical protein